MHAGAVAAIVTLESDTNLWLAVLSFMCMIMMLISVLISPIYPLSFADYEDDTPFGTNWTTLYDRDACAVHSVDGVIYQNLTEAIESCAAAGSACGGIGTLFCNADYGSRQYNLCSTDWRSVTYPGPMCVGVPDAQAESPWVLDTTDPYPVSFALGAYNFLYRFFCFPAMPVS
jgi:hypothetical protein